MDKSSPGKRRPFTAEVQRQKRTHQSSNLSCASPGPQSATTDFLDEVAMMHELSAVKDELRTLNHMLHAQFAPPEEDSTQEDPVLRDYERQKLEINILKTELRALANSIQETKREIAQLRTHDTDSDHLVTAASELDAIVGATETATEGILGAAEKIDTIAQTLQAHGNDSYLKGLADDITEGIVVIFEHCNFQDITGQRITKVVNTLKFIEERVDTMINIWGREAFNELVEEKHENDDDSRLLNGPQLGEHAITQDEINKLFD